MKVVVWWSKKKSLREKFKNCLLSHLCKPGQTQHDELLVSGRLEELSETAISQPPTPPPPPGVLQCYFYFYVKVLEMFCFSPHFPFAEGKSASPIMTSSLSLIPPLQAICFPDRNTLSQMRTPRILSVYKCLASWGKHLTKSGLTT